MWTIIWWDRELNQWCDMRGYNDESWATRLLDDHATLVCSNYIVSLSGPDGEIVFAKIGEHPSIGRCLDDECWCHDFSEDTDHTVKLGSSNA